MARQKRQYVAKIKGCYECSQRRINCDRSQPSCTKCVMKGVRCSGFGLRIRFNNGPTVRVKSTEQRRPSQSPESRCQGITPQHAIAIQSRQMKGNASESYQRKKSEPQSLRPLKDTITMISDHIDSKTRFLLSYFADKIAPEMTMIDDCSNQWRTLVLPIALEDDLVLNAVLAASAFHFTANVSSGCLSDSDRFYNRAIMGLKKKSNLNNNDRETQLFILISILVLLVAVLINGSTDYPILLRMLESAYHAVGIEKEPSDNTVTKFLLCQIRRMWVYSSPLLSMEEGFQYINAQMTQSFEDHRYYRNTYTKYSSTISLITDLVQQAYAIYVHRSVATNNEHQSFTILEKFRQGLSSIPEGSPGEHVLVWSVFIAAAESSTNEHQISFEQFLQRQYQRNGFKNILGALELLKRIWASDSHADWPSLLPTSRVLIM